MNNETAVSMKFENKVTGLSKLEKYEQRLKSLRTVMNKMPSTVILDSSKNISETLKSAEKVLKEYTNKLDVSKRKTKELNDNTSNFGGTVSTVFNIGKVAAFAKTIEQVTAKVAKFTSYSSDYIENLNLMDVAFQGATEEGRRFVDTLSEMYGLDESALARTVGLFKQLSNAMGLSDEIGTNLTKTMTLMANDISSLYNTSFERATSVLESALAGQTKPIRSLTGADITQTTLQVTLEAIGIDKTVSQLSYLEKRLLIVTSLIDQLDEAQNDYGRTIESVANQSRIFEQQISRLSRAIGNVFMPILSKVLPYLNAILMVMTEIINFIARLLGFKESDFDYFGETNDSVADLKDNLNAAGASAKKLKSGLRGFDRLNVITTPNVSSGGAGGGGINKGLLDAANKAMLKYQETMEKVRMKANDIRDSILKWLGFTIDENGEISGFHLTLGSILGVLGVGGLLYKGIKGILGILKKIGLIKFSSISDLVKHIGDIGKKAKDLAKIGDSGNLLSKLGISSSTASTISTVALVVGDIAAQLWSYDGVWGQILDKKSLGEFFKIDGPKDLIQTIFTITGLLQGGLLPFLIIGEEKMAKLDGTTSVLKQTFEDCKNTVIDFAEKSIDKIKKLYDENIKPTIDEILDLYNNDIKPLLEEALKFLDELFMKSGLLKSALSMLAEYVAGYFSVAFQLGFGATKNVVEFVMNYIGGKIEGITTIIRGVCQIIDGIVHGDWNKVWEGFKNVAVGAFKMMITPLKTVINSILGMVETMGNAAVTGINAVIKSLNKINIKVPNWDILGPLAGKEFSFNIKKLDKIELPRLKTGLDFVPNDYYPAYLDYGERVLTKEENKEYTRSLYNPNNSTSNQPINATFIIKVGDDQVAKKVLNNLQDMASANGKPITIG